MFLHKLLCILTTGFRIIPWPFLLAASSLLLPLLLPLLLLLADLSELTGTSQPTLGVLFFPLSPPSRKGATHNQKVLAPQLASKAELPLTYELRLPNSYQ
jgi:hypothetical protein